MVGRFANLAELIAVGYFFLLFIWFGFLGFCLGFFVCVWFFVCFHFLFF